MVNFVFHHDQSQLPTYKEDCHPVLIYNSTNDKWESNKCSIIANNVIDNIRDLGCHVSNTAFDFLTIAMAVTAADSFYDRKNSDNSWSREFNLEIPLYKPALWGSSKEKLEKALGFLTGDKWNLTFLPNGLAAPTPKNSKNAKKRLSELKALNSVCLFSGGLDSAVGAIDLINGKSDYHPLLISHAYKGDAKKQNEVANVLNGNSFSRLSINADPHIVDELSNKTDITMRGRSFNFLAMATIGLSALKNANEDENIKSIIIPENGYIALNPPLTSRRLGSLSTRTTHPYYLNLIEEVLNEVGISCQLINPYELKTKGEMLKECKDLDALKKAIPSTVSCSNWHRNNKQCGRCVPCIIRKSAIYKANINKDAPYTSEKLSTVANISGKDIKKDDVLALQAANKRLLNTSTNLKRWVRQSGPLPSEINRRNALVDTFRRGLKEVGELLKSEKLL
ncbi:Qat anti-phage system QueC-like protein QatC [Pseudoalteromonas lipolytica]